MDSRLFAILVLAIFNSFAPGFGEVNGEATTLTSTASVGSSTTTAKTSLSAESSTTTAKPAVPSAESSTTTAKPAVPSVESSTTTAKPVVLSVESSTATVKPAASIESSKTPSVKVDPVTVDSITTANTKPAELSTTSIPIAPVANSTDSAKSTEAGNEHSIRDVSESEKCSTAYNVADKVNWVPEKAIFAVLDGTAVVTIEQLCKQLVVIKRLDVICNSTKGKLDSDDSKVAPIVAGLTSMFSSICSDPKAAFNVPVGNSTQCVEFIQTTTKNCSTNPVAKAVHVFPTEVLFEEMMKENCTMVTNTKECIIKGLEQSDKCTEPQRAAVTQSIIMVTNVLPCNLPLSEETTPTPTDAPSTTTPTTTTPTTTTPTTTTPTVTTIKPHYHSSATGFQVNFLTVLPVLLLAFKFY